MGLFKKIRALLRRGSVGSTNQSTPSTGGEWRKNEFEGLLYQNHEECQIVRKDSVKQLRNEIVNLSAHLPVLSVEYI